MNKPNFFSRNFLRSHITSILKFYEPCVDDPHGGFFQNFTDNGEVFDEDTRHLVSSCRFVFNYAKAYLAFNKEEDLIRVKSGIDFIRQHHLNQETGGYHWVLSVTEGLSRPLDSTNHCYGLAFVVLAYSYANQVGLTETKAYLDETYQLMEKHFWDEHAGLYKDEYNADFSICSPYRGQNANMHSCEAMIAAYKSTKDVKYLDRAYLIADNVVNKLAPLAGDLIWEHYTTDWQVDWEYNKDDPKNLFRPWGFQPGHQTEWSKLLLMLNQLQPKSWLVNKAQYLFDMALPQSWDKKYGGICYGFDPQGEICDGEKYFWVQAESFAAAAMLYQATNLSSYKTWYNNIWHYSWQHLVDHEYGAWFRILTQDNQKIDNLKSPCGKTDYHTMGACYDVLALSCLDD